MQITSVPELKQLFWGDDLSDLSLEKNKKYIVQIVLEKGDRPAVNWLFHSLELSEIKEMFPSLKLSPKSKNFWELHLVSAEHKQEYTYKTKK